MLAQGLYHSTCSDWGRTRPPEVAEEFGFHTERRREHVPGAKAHVGPEAVMPGLKSRPIPEASFQQTLKPAPFKTDSDVRAKARTFQNGSELPRYRWLRRNDGGWGNGVECEWESAGQGGSNEMVLEESMRISRRSFLASLSLLPAVLARAQARLPANKNVKWAVSAALWNYFPNGPCHRS